MVPRALPRHLRTHGPMRAVLSHEPERPGEARLRERRELARRVTPFSEQDLVAEVSRTESEEWVEPLPPELCWRGHSDLSGPTACVVVYAVQWNILLSLRQRG